MIYVMNAKLFDVTQIYFNLFHVTDLFLYPTVNFRKLMIFWCFQELYKDTTRKAVWKPEKTNAISIDNGKNQRKSHNSL